MNDGGPAFPLTAQLDGSSVVLPGLSLRDYFAAAALPTLLSSSYNEQPDFDWQHAAMGSYAIADAMLAARSKFEIRASEFRQDPDTATHDSV